MLNHRVTLIRNIISKLLFNTSNSDFTLSFGYHNFIDLIIFCCSMTMELTDFSSIPISLRAATLLLVLAVFMSRFHGRKSKRYPPVGGTVLHQLVNFHRLHDFMAELARKHRTYRLLSFFRSEVYTSDPANVEYMLKSNFANYGKVCIYYFTTTPFDSYYLALLEEIFISRLLSSSFSISICVLVAIPI